MKIKATLLILELSFAVLQGPAGVHVLLVPSGPPAVAGLVVPIVVDPVDGMEPRRSPAHIGKEVLETLSPPFAHSNAAASPVLEPLVVRVVAPLAHLHPAVVLGLSGHPVPEAVCTTEIRAAARLGHAKLAGSDPRFPAAITDASPLDPRPVLAVADVSVFGGGRKPVALLPGDACEFTHVHTVPGLSGVSTGEKN